MKKNRSFQKIIILLVVFAIGLSAIYYFGFVDIRKKNENISKLNYELDLGQKKQQYVSSMERTVDSAKDSIEKINQSIVPADGYVSFIETIESIGKKEGLEVDTQSVSVEDETSGVAKDIAVLRMRTKVKGDWAGVYKFLAILETLPYKIKIDSATFFSNDSDNVRFEAGAKTASKIVWQGVFDIRVLKYK